MKTTLQVVFLGVLFASGVGDAAVVKEEMRQAMESQPLEFEVENLDLALSRAEEWLADTGHFPLPYGVTYLAHSHKGPQVERGKLVSRCRLAGNAPPRRLQLEPSGNPGFDGDTFAPTTAADRAALPLRVDWQFRVELFGEGNSVRIVPAKGTNQEMVSILARYIETGADACRNELTWLIDRPGHDPVAFDPVVYRQSPPTIDYRTCFGSP